MRGDEIRNVNESSNTLLLYVSADDRVESFEKRDGRVVCKFIAQ
jgi:hypothetical protein